jgi:hypothetical protein
MNVRFKKTDKGEVAILPRKDYEGSNRIDPRDAETLNWHRAATQWADCNVRMPPEYAGLNWEEVEPEAFAFVIWTD